MARYNNHARVFHRTQDSPSQLRIIVDYVDVKKLSMFTLLFQVSKKAVYDLVNKTLDSFAKWQRELDFL